MTDLLVMDAAYQPNLAACVAAGAIAINGYLTGKFATTTTSPAAAHAVALGWIATYEEGPAELVGATRAEGVAVGEKIAAAWRAHGIPDDGSIAVFPSVDIRVAAADAASCDNGWLGIRDVMASGASIRSYAEGAVIDHLVAKGLVDGKCWLSASSSYPGYNVRDENVCMYQQVGSAVGGTDTNHLITDPHALGAWWPDGSPYGGDMALTAAEATQLANAAKFAAAADARAQALQGQVSAQTTQITQLQSAVAALQAAVAGIQTGGIDPAALAQAIAQHVKLAAD